MGSRPACGNHSDAVLRVLEETLLQRPSLAQNVAVSTSGCIGPCFDGPNIVVYPEGIWYANVTEGDARLIASEHLIGGNPVAKLQYTWPE